MSNSKFKQLPPWSKMPEWAKFRAVDSTGELWVFEVKPTRLAGKFDLFRKAGLTKYALIGKEYDPTNWQDSLEEKPETEGPVLVPEVSIIDSRTNSPIGSQHWFNTILGRIARIGDYMQDHELTDELRIGWGNAISEECRVLIDNYDKIPFKD